MKWKICPIKRPKIQLDLTVESKSQLFDHNWLRSWPQLLSKGILNVMTLWSTIRLCCIYFFTLFGFETCNLASSFFIFFFFFLILAFVFTCELRLDKIRYWQMYVLISHICVIDAYIYIYERVYIYLLGFRFANSMTL